MDGNNGQMNLVAIQLADELRKYINRYNTIKDKYTDVEYLVWLSVTFGESDWPKEGEFVKARKDTEFRNFRTSFKKVDQLTEQLSMGVIEYDRQIAYRRQYNKDNPDAVPF